MNAYPDTENTMITPPPAPQKQWLVAYVKSCMEKKTAERLTAMGIEHYLPVQTVERRWSDRIKRMEKLVLPLMIFVHVTPKERPLPLTLSAKPRKQGSKFSLWETVVRRLQPLIMFVISTRGFLLVRRKNLNLYA